MSVIARVVVAFPQDPCSFSSIAAAGAACTQQSRPIAPIRDEGDTTGGAPAIKGWWWGGW